VTKHRITVLGTGDMGGAIAQALAERTLHAVTVRGSRPGSASAAALVDRLALGEATDADIEQSDIVFVVVPAKAIPEIAPTLSECLINGPMSRGRGAVPGWCPWRVC
jgi:predicted dinucleotide-binding enzyme